jgi:hypothetical protein
MKLRGAALSARLLGAVAMVGTLTGSLVVSCAGDAPSSTGGGSNAPASAAMGQWTPATQDTCSKAFHDTFFVIGPDGKKYPTWHRPEETDPATNQTCRFGHDHGANPSSSALWPALQKHFAFDANNNGGIDASELAVSGIPFGYVAEQLVNSTTPRLEDHTGYKIIFANAVSRTAVSGGNQFVSVTCDLFAAYNQPTSTADAFASNMFSVTYAADCNGGPSATQYPVKVIASVMAVYGDPGSFTLDANGTQQIVSQSPVPPGSPPGGGELGRRIPTADSVYQDAFVAIGQTSSFTGLAERWDTKLRLRRADTTELATLSPAFRVDNPARYFNQGLLHSVDLCYSGLNANGALVTDASLAPTIVRQVRNQPDCVAIAPNGPGTGAGQRIAFDDVRSPFNGCSRSGFFGAEVVLNPLGPTTWYTNAFGAQGSTVPFANSVRQFVAATNTGSIVLSEDQFGQQSFCQAATVHVPN